MADLKRWETKLFAVTWDGTTDFVEAVDMVTCLDVWRAAVIAENDPGDIYAETWPDSITEACDKGVIRKDPDR